MAKKLTFSLCGSNGSLLGGVTARLLFEQLHELRILRTDDEGQIATNLPRGAGQVRLEFGPIPGHWSIGENIDFSTGLTRSWEPEPLPEAAESLGWWHRTVGVRASDAGRGEGIRIGVIDTGCSAHPALAHVIPLGTFLGGELGQPGIDDELEHGTHVCGIVGARTEDAAQYVGIAPAAELLVARVEHPDSGPANQNDVANALDAMVARDVHLVNISLGARKPSSTLMDSIVNAWLNGVVCFAAAGNESGDVLWPAQHDRVVAVTALGRQSEVPDGSLAKLLLSDSEQTDEELNLTFAEFCCRGPQVRCCAPGVGIISTIGTPNGPSWADMSGSSMASPLALATIACVLSGDAEYRQAEPDEDRSRRVIDVLEEHCAGLNFPDFEVQGHGLVLLDFAALDG